MTGEPQPCWPIGLTIKKVAEDRWDWVCDDGCSHADAPSLVAAIFSATKYMTMVEYRIAKGIATEEEEETQWKEFTGEQD